MVENRTILFFIQDPEGISRISGDSLNFFEILEDSLGLSLAVTDIHRGKNVFSKNIRDYDLFSWDIRKIDYSKRICEIPKPGIIIAVRKTLEMSFAHALRLKNIVMNEQDMNERRFLDEFLNGYESKFEPFEYLSNDVFISYSKKDSDIANEIYTHLKNENVTCFMAEKDIAIGKIWDDEIDKALSSSKVVLLIITPNSIDSKWIMLESGAALALKRTIIPAFIYVSIEILPDPIKKYQGIDINTTDGRNRLYNEIQKALSTRQNPNKSNNYSN